MIVSLFLTALPWVVGGLPGSSYEPPGWGWDDNGQPPVVYTSSGHIHGKIDPALPNVAQYLGIPFATPPVGAMRWMAPQLLDQPDAEVQATQLPPSCMQYLTNQGNSLYVRNVLQFNLQGLNTTGAISEDCLTLSVWAPARDKGQSTRWGPSGWGSGHPNNPKQELLPVLIFIYGGGFSTGGEDVPYQIPAQWVNRTPDHLVVSFNYRVNIFGYPNAAGLSGTQNYGLLDQRAAVEWCYKNIKAFGGDPERMVIWGQSAGLVVRSISVDYYTYTYPNDPIVTGLIMDSGTAFSPIAVSDSTHSNFTFVADHVGCGGLAADPEKQLSCMRSVPADTLENFFATYQESGASPALGFTPIIDNEVVFANYTERALAGDQAKIPAIIGTNTQDGVPFVPYLPTGPTNQTEVLAAMLDIFFCPATESVRVRQQTNLMTFRYEYGGNFSNISPEPWMGAYHSSELPMLMGTYGDFRGPGTPLEAATSVAFQDAYVAFASDSTGMALESTGWMEYTQLGADQVREFGVQVPVQDVSLKNLEDLCIGAVPEVPLPTYTGTCCSA